MSNVKTQFKPGQSGNPAGRPKGSGGNASIAVRLAKELLKEEVSTSDGKKISYADAITIVLVKEAVKGRRWAIELVMNYIDGRPVSQHDINLEVDVEENKSLLDILQEAKKKREDKHKAQQEDIINNGTD